MLGIDVSNHNNLSVELSRAVNKGHNPQLVIVRGSLENSGFIATAHDQCEETIRRGLNLDIYGWGYATADDPVDFAHRLVDTYGPHNPGRWWIDCEEDMRENGFKSWYAHDPARNIAWLKQVIDAFEAQGLLEYVGIYTGHWFWTGTWMANNQEFAHLPLWNATDTKEPNLMLGWPYGGWEPPYAAVQFDLSGPDLDVMDDGLYTALPEPGGNPDPEPEPEPTPEDVQSVMDRLSRLGGLEHDKIPAWILEMEAVLEARAGWKEHANTVLEQLREYAVYDDEPPKIGD